MSIATPTENASQPASLDQLQEVAVKLVGKNELPVREQFFKTLHAAIAHNENKWLTRNKCLVLGYFKALLDTPAFARSLQKRSKPLSPDEARVQGEALVEKFVLSRMAGFLPGKEEYVPPYNAHDEEQFAMAGELLGRRFTCNNILSHKPLVKLTDAEGKHSGPTMETVSHDRRGFNGHILKGLVGLGLVSTAVLLGAKNDLHDWPYKEAIARQHKKAFQLQQKLATKFPITYEDIQGLDIERVADEISDRPNAAATNRELNMAHAKIALGTIGAGVLGGKLLWDLFTYQGNQPDRAVHTHSQMMLNVGRQLDSKTRALYESIAPAPLVLPAEAGKSL